MPIYENRNNAENKIKIPQNMQDEISVGLTASCNAVAKSAQEICKKKSSGITISMDGWYGVAWNSLIKEMKAAFTRLNIKAEFSDTAMLFLASKEIDAYKKPYLSNDPSFGKVNSTGTIDDILDMTALTAMSERLKIHKNAKSTPSVLIVYGCASLCRSLAENYDLMCYFDKTADPMLWDMWDGRLIPFGQTEPKADYGWKEYYYCDFYLLNRHKQDIMGKIDFYLEAIDSRRLVLVPKTVFWTIMETLSRQPIKQIKTYSPGPWGAYRYRDLWNIPGLECNAWNRLAGADLSMLVEVAPDIIFTMPSGNLLLKHGEAFVGKAVHERCPGLIPVEVWLDDGYFPETQPAERTSMPIHNHPSSAYVKEHFNEPLGRYETYYIAEAYKGANTWMGFKEDADLEQWEDKIKNSWKNKTPIADWKEFIANWETVPGDLFLIPPGTTHGHGGNQMVLEMDTCPSVCGCEYSFFGYDFMRPTWDDRKKNMTGRPMNMQLEHYLDNDKWCRESWVKEHLRARPFVVEWNKEFSLERYSSYGPMPFEIERLHFQKSAKYTTAGKFLQAMTLTVGTRAVIRSKQFPDRFTEIEKFQSALIPADFGDYEIINCSQGDCTVVIWRMKDGFCI